MNPTQTDAHSVTLKADWNPEETPPITGWRATCSCGWKGGEHDREFAAGRDARTHLAESETTAENSLLKTLMAVRSEAAASPDGWLLTNETFERVRVAIEGDDV